MIGRKSLGNVLLEQGASSSNNMSPLRRSTQIIMQDAPVLRSPNSSSPLRRKSIIAQKALPINLSENDDEAERNALRRERVVVTTSGQSNLSERRRSLGLGFLAHMPAPQIAERIAQCIKLSTENKINVKNAFSLEIIDFMAFMIKKQDADMSNLQVASTSLDVSTKIYGFRVDSVHTDIIKMISGLEQVKEANTEQVQGNDSSDSRENNGKAKKKRKKVLDDILATEESLAMNLDQEDSILIKMKETDSQTTDTLHQKMLPNHVFSKYYLHAHNDIVVDSTIPNIEQNNVKEVFIDTINVFTDCNIYPSLKNFQFQEWCLEDEPEEEPEPEEHIENEFHFDPDASLPDEDPVSSGLNYFDIEDDNEEMNRCAARSDAPEKIVDLCNIVTGSVSSKVSEYSFVQKTFNLHWAGPAHWKIRAFSKPLNGSKVVGDCHQDKIRTRKEIELKYDNKIMQIAESKLQPSQSIKLNTKTVKTDWDEKKLILPEDVHYDIMQTQKLYLIPDMIVYGNRKNISNASLITDGEINYNYNNENDANNYCPALDNDDCNGADDNDDNVFGFEDDNEVAAPTAFMGDNLVSLPKMVDQVSIHYSLRPKRIDMKQLKKSIWKCLTSDNDKENINEQQAAEQRNNNVVKDDNSFGEVYKVLPNLLTKNNVEALSFPIAFVSLLHLANEKTLDVTSVIDMSDLIVKQESLHK